MSTASESQEELPETDNKSTSSRRSNHKLSNPTIEKKTMYPREQAHEDYKYLITSIGPLLKTNTSKKDEQD